MVKTAVSTAVLVILILGLWSWSRSADHSCVAPCTVQFPKGMEEDQFNADYADEQLRVWKIKPGEPEGYAR